MSRLTDQELKRRIVEAADDPAERKRLHSVLAQRRYRRRKKARNEPDETAISPSEHLFSTSNDAWLDDNWLTASGNSEISLHGFEDMALSPDVCLDTGIVFKSPQQLTSGMTNQDFYDEAHIEMPELSLVKAHVVMLKSILDNLDLPMVTSLWNPFAISPFYGSSIQQYPGIPTILRPTKAQISIAHHPVFDILPWSSARTKILLVLTMPVELRPSKAQLPMENMAMELKFDMMDVAEGVRVHGKDAFDVRNWEIGQKIFDNWWWALDLEIVRISNAHRANRGLQALRLRPAA